MKNEENSVDFADIKDAISAKKMIDKADKKKCKNKNVYGKILNPTLEQVQKVLQYDKNTFSFYWKGFRTSKLREGMRAGGLVPAGYWMIKIFHKKHMEHRLVWLFETGEWPIRDLDHINGIRSDNRITNLRIVSRRENSLNTKKHRNGKLGGAVFCKNRTIRPWKSAAKFNNKLVYFGYYDTQEEAHNEYKKQMELRGINVTFAHDL